MKLQGDLLLMQLHASPGEEVANQLLAEFDRGYPVEQLRGPLVSDDVDVVRSAVWIASELGSRVIPLLREIKRLAEHPNRYVRFFALEAIGASGTLDGEVLAAIGRAVEDADEAVRWKAMRVFLRLGRVQLTAMQPFLIDTVEAEVIEWLINPESHAARVRTGLVSESRAERLMATVAAARAAQKDSSLLRFAAESANEEERVFAVEMLDEIG